MIHYLLAFAAWYLGIGLVLILLFLLIQRLIGLRFGDTVTAAMLQYPQYSRGLAAFGLVGGVLLKWPLIVIGTIKGVWKKRSQPQH